MSNAEASKRENSVSSGGGNPERGGRGQEAGGAAATQLQVALLVALLLAIFVFLILVLFTFWPDRIGTSDGTPVWNRAVPFFGIETGYEVRLFVLVVVAGALGSYIHVATSAGDYIGNRNLVRSWIYWYLLRLPVGASLALLIYLLLRGGVLTGGTGVSVEDEPPYGIVGLSALAGMFAKKASNKLGEVFETLFRTQKDEVLADKNYQIPVLEKIEPNPLEVEADAGSATIRLIGANFRVTSRVLLDKNEYRPQFVDERELSLRIEKQHLEPRSVEVHVVTPEVDGGRSASVTLEIRRKSAN